MNFSIRFAIKTDMKPVYQLITELAIFENEPKAVEISIEDLERDGFSSNPKFKIFVAQEENEIIGMALFYQRYSTWKGKAIHLEDLIVTESKRKLGVGKALYTELMKYAFKNGYKRVVWEVLDWNKNAIDFYENTNAKIMQGWQIVHMEEKELHQFAEKN